MILETRGDTIHLSGYILGNMWPLIEDALGMILPRYPNGITIECRAVRSISDEGLETFVDALEIGGVSGAPLVIANLSRRAREILESRVPRHGHCQLGPPLGPPTGLDVSEPPAWWDRLFSCRSMEPPGA